MAAHSVALSATSTRRRHITMCYALKRSVTHLKSSYTLRNTSCVSFFDISVSVNFKLHV